MAFVRNLKPAALAAAIAGVVGSGSGWSFGATDTYTGGANNNWDTAGNWSLGGEPSAGDDAIFPLAVPASGRVILLTPGETANTLTFNNSYVLQGGDLTLTFGPVTVDAGPVGQSIDAVGFGSTIASTVFGSNGLNKGGGGTLFLVGNNSAANGLTGFLNVSAGKLAVINDTNLGAVTTLGGSVFTVNSLNLNGGVLQLDATTGNAGAGFLQVNRAISIGSNGGTIDVPLTSGAGLETLNAFSGTGTLTKTGLGQFFLLNSNNFSSPIVTALNGGSFDVRSSGALTGAASITINPGSNLNVDNNAGIANSLGILASVANTDRIGNNTPINLNGGSLIYNARNLAGGIREVFGSASSPVTLNQGQSTITSNANGAGGEIEIGNLARTPSAPRRRSTGAGRSTSPATARSAPPATTAESTSTRSTAAPPRATGPSSAGSPRSAPSSPATRPSTA